MVVIPNVMTCRGAVYRWQAIDRWRAIPAVDVDRAPMLPDRLKKNLAEFLHKIDAVIRWDIHQRVFLSGIRVTQLLQGEMGAEADVERVQSYGLPTTGFV